MLLSGSRAEQQQQLMVIQEGYEMFRPLPVHELPLIESLRTLRLMKYAGLVMYPLAGPGRFRRPFRGLAAIVSGRNTYWRCANKPPRCRNRH